MPRRSSAGKSAPRTAPRRNNPVPPRPRNNPAPATAAPPRAPTPHRNNPVDRSPRRAHVEEDYSDRRRSRSPSSGGSFFGTVGKAVVAYSIVRGLANAMSPSTSVKEAAAPGTALPDACGSYAKAFMDCVNGNSKDIGKCQRVMDRLSLCRTRLTGAIPTAHTT